MASGASNSSTEKLLGIIRGGKSAADPDGDRLSVSMAEVPEHGPEPSPGFGDTAGRRVVGMPTPLKSGKNCVVGVDAGPDSLIMVKMSAGADGGRRLSDYRSVPYVPGAGPGTPGFINFFRENLRRFCPERDCAVWTLAPSSGLELWHTTIPRVPRAKIGETVYWTVKREKQFDEREYLLDFELQGEVSDKGVRKYSVMTYLVPRADIEERKELFARAGVKLAGMTVAPVALQNLFRTGWVPGGTGTCAIFFNGRNWSRIDLFSGGNLVMSRGVRSGTNSLIESLMDGYNRYLSGRKSREAQVSEPVISFELEGDGSPVETRQKAPSVADLPEMDFELARDTFHSVLEMGEEGQVPLGQDEAFEFVEPAAERLARQIERTFEYYTHTLGHEDVSRIYFSGDFCANPRVLHYLEGQLALPSGVLDPLDPSNPNLGPGQVPRTLRDRLAFNLVSALALSNIERTPNLLFTYKDKEQARRNLMWNNALAACFAVIILALGAFYWVQSGRIDAREETLAALNREVQSFSPRVDSMMLARMAGEVHQRQELMKQMAVRFEGLSVLSELTALTPGYVKLMSVDAAMGDPAADKDDAAEKPARGGSKAEKDPRTLILDGVIAGEFRSYDALLASYLIRLQASPLFEGASVHEREIEDVPGEGKALHFIVHLSML